VRSPLPRLHAITDERIARRKDLDSIATALAEGGGSDLAFHARGRGMSGLEHYELAVRLSYRQSVRLFVNDRLDVALAVPTAGVQLGHGSLAVSAARALQPRWWIGKSVHDFGGGRGRTDGRADLSCRRAGFCDTSHPGRPPLGVERLQAIVVAVSELPVIAIGGISVDRVREVRRAGAHGIAAIRALWDDVDAAAAIRRMREELVE
jgi:thiamine-phosphate pyrophosphorylase